MPSPVAGSPTQDNRLKSQADPNPHHTGGSAHVDTKRASFEIGLACQSAALARIGTVTTNSARRRGQAVKTLRGVAVAAE